MIRVAIIDMGIQRRGIKMKKLLFLIGVMGAGLLVSGGAHAFGTGLFGADHTGFADAGLGCGSCHGAAFHGNSSVTLLIQDAGMNDVTAGPLLSSTVYTLTVTITEDAPASPDQWGFQLQVLQDIDNAGSGTLVAGVNSHINNIGGVDFWAHDDVNQNSFTTTWTSDATGNNVTFRYAGVSAVEAGGTGQTSRVTNLTTSTALPVTLEHFEIQ